MTSRGAERRRAARAAPQTAAWQAEALVRPGLSVQVLDISSWGALVECSGRLRPGRLAELQLTSLDGERRLVARGLVGRCRVTGLAPLRYQGAIAFERPLTAGGEPG